MADKVQVTKDILSQMSKELEAIWEHICNSPEAEHLESTRDRLNRWGDRSWHKLSLYLIPAESDKFGTRMLHDSWLINGVDVASRVSEYRFPVFLKKIGWL